MLTGPRLQANKIYIITSEAKGGPQIEFSIRPDGFGIAELAKSGTRGIPPFTIEQDESGLHFTHSKTDEAKDVAVIDKDGDGLPEQRLSTFHDKDGKLTKILLEKITISFSTDKEKLIPPH